MSILSFPNTAKKVILGSDSAKWFRAIVPLGCRPGCPKRAGHEAAAMRGGYGIVKMLEIGGDRGFRSLMTGHDDRCGLRRTMHGGALFHGEWFSMENGFPGLR